MIQSIIAKNLIASYLRANYQISAGADSISLQIEQYSEALAKILIASGQSCAAIISAYNPHSLQLSNEKNLAAHRSLRDFLDCHSYPIIESLNLDPANSWPAEKSFLVPGLDLNTAQTLGQQYDQNAIVWSSNDAIPHLILLR